MAKTTRIRVGWQGQANPGPLSKRSYQGKFNLRVGEAGTAGPRSKPPKTPQPEPSSFDAS